MSSISLETKIGEQLVGWLNTKTDAQILSFHPPSSKAYASDLIRIPKLNADGSRSRSRNHVDVVFITAHELWLVELKGKYSESADDILKLAEIKSSYSDKELITFISNRVTVPLTYDLNHINEVVTAIGVSKIDVAYNNEIPVFVIDDSIDLFGHPIEKLITKKV
jgi:hypothetical protein